jgi:hypothetical protein
MEILLLINARYWLVYFQSKSALFRVEIIKCWRKNGFDKFIQNYPHSIYVIEVDPKNWTVA